MKNVRRLWVISLIEVTVFCFAFPYTTTEGKSIFFICVLEKLAANNGKFLCVSRVASQLML